MNQLDLALDEVFNPTRKQENHMHGTIKSKKRITSTFKERLAIHNLLKTHLRQDGDLWVYDEGWDDQRVAQAVNPDFNIDHAKTVRLEVFGKLRKVGSPDKVDLLQRIESLEELYLKLAEKVGA